MKNKNVSSVNTAIIALISLFFIFFTTANAQQLPAPSRTVFKCNASGKIVYSDSPCLGAERIDADPPQGINSTSGKRAVGADRGYSSEMVVCSLFNVCRI